MKHLCLAALLFVGLTRSNAQNSTLSPTVFSPPKLSYSAILDLPSPQEGDMAFDITYKCLRVFIEGKWLCSHQDPANYAPNMLAIATVAGSGSDSGNGIAVDGNGNVYVTGYFQSTATFGTVTKVSAGNNDIFVAKYDKTGVLQWVQTAGGTGSEEASSIAVDGSGNIYVAGYFQGSTAFGSTARTSLGNSDVFVAKYSTGGVLEWVEFAGGNGSDVITDIGVDGNGKIYVTGYFIGSISFGSISKTAAGSYDGFLAGYDPTGANWNWVHTFGGTNDDLSNKIAIDSEGNVYITGIFSGTATFGSPSITSKGFVDVFVAKYNSGGTFQWVHSAGGTNYDGAGGIAVDSNGNVYVTGNFYGNISFGSIDKTTAGNNDIFLAKYDTNGNFHWAQTLGGALGDYSNGIAVDGSGNIYVTGYFQDYVIFGSMPKMAVGSNDVFVAKYNSNGTTQWVQTAGGRNAEFSNDIIVDGNNNVFVTGRFEGTANFGRNSKTSAGFYDGFVFQLDK